MAPTYAGGLKYLDANIVGVSDQVDQSPVLAKQFKDVDKVGAEDVEKVASLKPDLIITYNTDKNTDKLKKLHQRLLLTMRNTIILNNKKQWVTLSVSQMK